MIEVSRYIANANLESDKIWHVPNTRNISYPMEGNEDCFELEEKSFWFCHRNRIISMVVKKYSPCDVFFDIGGGNGYVAKLLHKLGYKVVLVEPGAKGVSHALARGLRSVVQGAIEDCLFHTATVPAFGIFDVLEHIEDQHSYIARLRDALIKQGILYVTVPAYSWLWSEADTLAGHYRRYSLDSLTNVLKSSGFRIDYATYFFSILPAPILLFRALRSLRARSNKQKNSDVLRDLTGWNKTLNALALGILSVEQWFVGRSISMFCGSSCLVVARKI